MLFELVNAAGIFQEFVYVALQAQEGHTFV